jgi:integrase
VIESTFKWESARIRQRKAPLLKEREEYLLHMLHQGTSEQRLRSVASILNGPLTSTVTWRMKYQLLARFFEFWSSRGAMPVLLMPPPRSRVRQCFIPYVYTRLELKALVRATVRSQIQVNCTIEAQTFRTLLLLLYGTGAFIGELLELRHEDVNLRTRKITIGRKKFGRYLQIPIGNDLHDVLRKYLNWRLGVKSRVNTFLPRRMAQLWFL